MDYFVPISQTSEPNKSILMLEEFNSYLKSPIIPNEDPVSYWSKSQSTMRTLALEVLSVSASSVPVKRVFSQAGRVLSPLRTRLSPNRLDQILMIAINK